MADEPVLSAAEVARLAGVGRAAVSNWRRRYPDFPTPVASGGFRLSDVEGWLRAQGKLPESDPFEIVWRAVDPGRADLIQRVADVCTALAGEAEEGRLGLDARVRDAVAEADAADIPAQVLVENLTRRLFERQQHQSLVTPHNLASLISELAEPFGHTVFDPACGSGNLLTVAATFGAKHVAGQEIDSALVRIARARLTASKHAAPTEVAGGDALRADAYPDQQADIVLCDPPFGYRDWGHEELSLDQRWAYGQPVKSEPELAWVQHCLAHAKPGGQVIIVLPAGVAGRRPGRAIRATMVRRGVLRAVIALPPGVLRSTGIPVHIWALRNPADEQTDPVLLLDMSDQQPAKRGELDWPALTAAVVDTWREFTTTGSVSTIPGRQRVVEPIDLLDEEVDLTPATHNPPEQSTIDIHALTKRRAMIIDELRALPDLLPEIPTLTTEHHPRRTIADLAKAGALTVQAQPRFKQDLIEHGAGPLVLTGRDVANNAPPTLRLPEPAPDPIPLRAGDLLLPQLSSASARPRPLVVPPDHPVDLVLGPNLHLVRVNEERIDVDYLAGYLASTQTTSTTASGIHRLDLRRITIPVPDIATQRQLGIQFRRLNEFRVQLTQLATTGTTLTTQIANLLVTD